MKCPYCEKKEVEAEVIKVGWLSRCERCLKKINEQEGDTDK